MEFNRLSDLLNTGFIIIEFGLLYDGEHLVGSENVQIPDLFWQDYFKMAIFGWY